MSPGAQAQLAVAEPEAPAGSSPFFTIRLLRAASDFIDARRWMVFAAVSIGCGWGHIISMASRHLDHDELFTFYISQARTVGELLRLTHTIDLHPPLSYLLVRSSFAIFGASAWSCRLPYFLAFILFSALLFSFTSNLLSPIYGIVTTLILWSSTYAQLASKARPYSMVLCFTALMLVSWYRIVEEDGRGARWWTFAALVAAGGGLLLSHVLGVLAYGSFLAAETVRLWIRRRPDWRLWLALLIPLPSVLAYLPLIHLRSGMLFSPWSQASPRRLAICYWEHVRYLATPLALIGLTALAWPLIAKRQQVALKSPSPTANLSLRWLLFFLLLVPVEIAILFARTGTSFYERYGVVALIPCAMFPVIFLGYRTHCNRTAAGSMAFLLAVLLFLNTSGKAWLTGELASIAPPAVAVKVRYLVALPPIAPSPLALPAVPPYVASELGKAPPISHLESIGSDLPLVAGSGPTFLELDRYQDTAVTQRLYLLTDHEAATTIAHNTVFDHYELLKPMFPIRGQVEEYGTFIRRHSQFLVLSGYNYPDAWLLRKLEMDGARLHIVGTYDDGVIEEHHIYRVNVEKSP